MSLKRLREVYFIIILCLAVLLILAVATYHPQDSAWSHIGTAKTQNAVGILGAWLADILFLIIGIMAYFLPLFIGFIAWRWLMRRDQEEVIHLKARWRVLGAILFLFSASALCSMNSSGGHFLPAGAGGILGSLLDRGFEIVLNRAGATLVLFALLLSGLTLSAEISWFAVADGIGRLILSIMQLAWQRLLAKRHKKRMKPAKAVVNAAEDEQPVFQLAPRPQEVEVIPSVPKPVVAQKPKKVTTIPAPSMPVPSLETVSLELLNHATKPKAGQSYDSQHMSTEVEQRLLDFGIKVEVVGVHPGPVVTRFELALAPGVKANRITNLSSDLARSLSVVSVRVVEVIPGKSVVGLEIPNQQREMVSLREVLESTQYQESHSPLSLALGKDISGKPVVVDLSKMPHLLVAGTTGSGKSVGLNSMLLSLLFKSTPEEVRLIMVDPKMLELAVYNGIPHLLTPVVTDMREAANVLRWSVAEMEKRYRLMASQGVRNIAGYNDKIKEAHRQKAPIKPPEWYASQCANGCLETLPLIVVVIDEFADMMMVVGKKVEQLIARIAQKARAAGIHLILATQRPSVNVITGLIKANIPTRIAFQVSSKIDSRTILDQQGAQQLLGNGDMLYLPPGSGVPMRVHGAFVADDEVHRVVAAWKNQAEPAYLDLNFSEYASEDSTGGEDGEGSDNPEEDPLYDQAVEIVVESRRASISGIQRRLRIGYNRAARLVEAMEAAGLVGPMESSGNREVLVPGK